MFFMKKIAISQSNYIPWKGYFDLINSVDEFIIYDEMQYTKRDWRNRNKIKTISGEKWLSVDVESMGSFSKKINEVKVIGDKWRKKHWMTISQSYAKAPFFKNYRDIFESLYLDGNEVFLTEINISFIKTINEILDIKTKIHYSKNLQLSSGKTERLVSLCEQLGGSEYLSGPAARDYIDESLFLEKDIKLTWMSYDGYPVYEQLFGEFTHYVSVLDLLFNVGPNAKKYMLSFKEK